jgi:hypothetical protein
LALEKPIHITYLHIGYMCKKKYYLSVCIRSIITNFLLLIHNNIKTMLYNKIPVVNMNKFYRITFKSSRIQFK